MYLLQSGAVYMEMEFGEWYVEVEFTMVGLSRIAERCQARNANCVVLSIFIIGH